MDILCLSLSTFDKIGGIQTFNKFFYRALNENKFNFKIISLHDTKSPNKNVYVCKSNYIRFIYFLLKFSKPETILIWQHVTLGLFLPFLKLFRKTNSNIITLYGTEVWGKRLSILKRVGFMSMDYYWCISQYTADQIYIKYKLPKQKIRLFPCCIDLPMKLKLNPTPYGITRFNILSILRLDKSGKLNAIYDVIKILPNLIKKFNNIHYTIIGEGNFKKEIIKDIKKRKLENYISILGYVENTAPYLEHCDVFTLTSPLEGFGIVYLEAMLYKKPCIASKNCGSEDVVLNNKTGYSIDISDFRKLESIICKLYVNNSERINLGNKGFEHLIQNFTFSKFKENQAKLLFEI